MGFLRRLLARLFVRGPRPKLGDRVWWAARAKAGIVTGVKRDRVDFAHGKPTKRGRRTTTTALIADATWSEAAQAWVFGQGPAAPPRSWGGWTS